MEFKIDESTKILVVTPHQDDETIGCGGFLALYGRQCDILLLTDGRFGISDSDDYEKNIKIRDKELDEAMKLVSVNKIFKLNIKNNELNKNKAVVRQFNIKDYDLILLPNRKEAHCDHRPILNIFRTMKISQRAKASIYEYEVWTPLLNPTNILDIGLVIETKRKMLKKYKSQLKEKNYLEAAIGLNRYRGLAYDNEYGEAYMNSSYNPMFGKLYELLPEKLKEKIRKMLGGK